MLGVLKFIRIVKEKKVVNVGKTISAFFQFILEDPVMLGLCIAIAVLVVLFIVVLVLGRRADKKDAQATKSEENLLKTEIDLSVLADPEESQSVATNVPEIVETFTDATEVPVEVPIEPVQVEFTASEFDGAVDSEPEAAIVKPDEVANVEKQPPLMSFEDFKIETPTTEEIADITQEQNVFDEEHGEIAREVLPVEETVSFDESKSGDNESPLVELLEEEKEPVVDEAVTEVLPLEEPAADVQEIEEVVNEPDYSDYLYEPGPAIVESAVNPVGEADTSAEVPSIEEQMNVELPIVDEQSKKESIEDIYSYDDELPDIKVEDFSRTSLIRHIPVLDMKMNFLFEEDDKKSELDDLDLPKLKSSASDQTSFNSLKGESFDIPKNS